MDGGGDAGEAGRDGAVAGLALGAARIDARLGLLALLARRLEVAFGHLGQVARLGRSRFRLFFVFLHVRESRTGAHLLGRLGRAARLQWNHQFLRVFNLIDLFCRVVSERRRACVGLLVFCLHSPSIDTK